MDFDGPVHYERPVTDKVYCFTSMCKDRFHTLFFSPLMPYLVSSAMDCTKVLVGEILFVGSTDKPMFLIPFDDEPGGRHVLERIEYNLYPSGNVPPGGKAEVSIPITYSSDVYPQFHYQINHGKLYKSEGTEWTHVPI